MWIKDSITHNRGALIMAVTALTLACVAVMTVRLPDTSRTALPKRDDAFLQGSALAAQQYELLEHLDELGRAIDQATGVTDEGEKR